MTAPTTVATTARELSITRASRLAILFRMLQVTCHQQDPRMGSTNGNLREPPARVNVVIHDAISRLLMPHSFQGGEDALREKHCECHTVPRRLARVSRRFGTKWHRAGCLRSEMELTDEVVAHDGR